MNQNELTELAERVEHAFANRFGDRPTLLVAAPGRVNLIGEHIDYNDGFVLPLAIERYVVIAASPTDRASVENEIRVESLDLESTIRINLDSSVRPGRSGWGSYVDGVVSEFMALGVRVPAFDAVIGSSVPLGGGLSSSAALEVAMATLLEQLAGHDLGMREKALLCQAAEHRFAGVPCGIMDQFSSVFARADELMLIDCQSQTVKPIVFDTDENAVLIINSNVKHSLASGEYATRRTECESAIAKLGLESWRNVNLRDLEASRPRLTDTEFRRGRHVVKEIQRTRDTAAAIENKDWPRVGKLMNASHDSLRDDYQVSCHELDVLVEITRAIGQSGGVVGSRMTGGGFGGCTVSIVETRKLSSVIELVRSEYESKTGLIADCFATRPGRGAHVIRNDSKSG